MASDQVILDAAIATVKQGTKLFVVEGIRSAAGSQFCTCGKLLSDCQNGGKIQAGKHPIMGSNSPYPKNADGKHSWTLASTNDQNKIAQLLSKHPYNIAVHAGANNLIIVDIDTPEGINWFNENINLHPEWFNNPIDISGYKDDAKTIRGIHVYCLQPVNHINGFNTKFGECRCDDQYAVISPSNHYTGIRYECYKGHSWTELPLSPIHEGFLAFLQSIRKGQDESILDTNTEELFKQPILELTREAFINSCKGLRISDYTYNLLTTEYVSEADDRSGIMHMLEHQLAKYKVSYEQTCVLIWNCAYNKFKTRKNGMHQVRSEVYSVYLAEGLFSKQPEEQESPYNRKPAQSCREFLLMDIPQEMWAVRRCLLRRSKSLIAGESKSGKSTLAYILAASVASGKDFLNDMRYEVQDQGPVMFIDGENSTRYIKQQIIRAYLSLGILTADQLESAYKIKPNQTNDVSIPNIYVYDSSYGLNFMDDEGMAFIEEEIKRIKPVLVIWDSFYTFFTGDVKEEKDVLPILNNLTRWRTKHDTGVAIVVHFNKGGGPSTVTKSVDVNRISGTKVFGNWFESAWLVSNPNAAVDDTGEEVDESEDDLAGEMVISLRCVFREARKRSNTVTLKMTSLSCDVSVVSGIKEKEIAADNKNVKFKIEEMPQEIINYYNAHYDGYARSPTNLCVEICNQDKRFSRDRLRLAIERMRQDGMFKIVKGKNGGELLELSEHLKIKNNGENDDL